MPEVGPAVRRRYRWRRADVVDARTNQQQRRRQTFALGGRNDLSLLPVAHQRRGGIEHRGPGDRRLRHQFDIVRRSSPLPQRTRQLALAGGKAFHAIAQAAGRGRAVNDFIHQPGSSTHRLNGIGGYGPGMETIGQAQARTCYLQQRQQVVGTVFVEEIVIVVRRQQLPKMPDQPIQLRRRERQAVLPQIAVLKIVVVAHLLEIGREREAAVIPAGQPLPGVTQTDWIGGMSGVVDGRRQQARAFVLTAPVEAQQGMSEHRRRIIEKGGRKNECRALRVERLAECPETPARRLGQTRRVEGQSFLQPGITGDETTLRGLLAFILRAWHKEGGQRRRQFCLRIAPAVRRVEECRIVVEALDTAAEGPRLVVQQPVPFGMVRKAQLLRTTDQILQITGVAHRRHYKRQAEQGDRYPLPARDHFW